MSNLIFYILEIIGIVAFAISGAMVAVSKKMDMFGVVMLGIITAVGGGVMRDLILGITPPAIFIDPILVGVAAISSLLVFPKCIRNLMLKNEKAYDIFMLAFDSIGLGLFTVVGANIAITSGFGSKPFLVVCVSAITGTGGGVLRDVLAGERPYIFVKHFYALPAIIGAVATVTVWHFFGKTSAIISGTAIIILLRILAATFRWSLPKAKEIEKPQD